MRIVFMGTPDFAVPSLEALIARGDTVVGVFTQPDKPKGRGKKLTPPPVKVAAEAHGIPVFQPRRIRKDGLEDLKALAPDLCVTAAFGQLLSRDSGHSPSRHHQCSRLAPAPPSRQRSYCVGHSARRQAGGHHDHVYRQGH